MMQITHVIRGEEHLANTPKHILLFEAFGAALPQFAHLPLMMNPGGKKMSKRDTNVGLILVHQFRDEGFLPEAVLNFCALLGWNPGDEREFFSLDELIHEFSLERVQNSNAVYDFNRALRFNSEYIKRLDDASFVQRTKDYLFLYGDEERKEIVENTDDAYWMSFAPHIKVRIQTL
ncbi:MAG: hypothetical protein H6765_06335 [Candidatus Peribacteria bacterium]|nr:MAG: hypothetical protein H6765_06335 [Candidatus Peribacteria bacterium]